MRYLILLSVLMAGCASKEETPIKHEFCVLSHNHKVGDARFTCTVTARFDTVEACKQFEQAEVASDPAPHKDGRLTIHCKGE